jgi:hypothetical protein
MQKTYKGHCILSVGNKQLWRLHQQSSKQIATKHEYKWAVYIASSL